MAIYSDLKPQVLEAVGNGSYIYHYDMTEVDGPAEDGEQDAGEHWQYEAVTARGANTANKLREKVLTARWDANYEQKLVNEYSSAQMGLLSEEEAARKTEAYKAFLTERNRLKAQVDSDCAELGTD